MCVAMHEESWNSLLCLFMEPSLQFVLCNPPHQKQTTRATVMGYDTDMDMQLTATMNRSEWR